ncbi:MAG TPA: glycosyltransferase, partial [Bacteroidia bacterium]|nr:glycosyltransferase [Bacteroidia bacterium]
LTKKIESICEKNKNAILFGCNSEYFYQLIPLLPSEIKCMDLIHAFVHKYEPGPEKWSLPLASRLNKRIVINEKTKIDFEKLYLSNNIDYKYLSRIICIPNFVEHKQYIVKEKKSKLKILYVGRGTPEKRVYLIAQIAYELIKNNVNVEFHFAGNVKDAIPEKYLSYCILHGEIVDEKMMEKIYSDSQILIMTSSREGFPMVIMEAMMQSVVPISTNVGGISEHIINKVNGILINDIEENEIVSDCVKAIEYFKLNQNDLAEMSINAHKYALTHFDKKYFVESYKKILDN